MRNSTTEVGSSIERAELASPVVSALNVMTTAFNAVGEISSRTSPAHRKFLSGGGVPTECQFTCASEAHPLVTATLAQFPCAAPARSGATSYAENRSLGDKLSTRGITEGKRGTQAPSCLNPINRHASMQEF
ncbi:hypothetical protein mRhiFer1_009567 [Rhinolophus ferrumequinum]|uniref:Uncharacterized protein n=1 Tax=Rhinolophus ferrumequinum TaxID=59479 RepID=A0A7J7ZQB5_RHIFE|nr:hypothetical protein mRhiFer1_009567 [Rhinolophus ferrumequinum]